MGYSPWGRWESDTTERLHFQENKLLHETVKTLLEITDIRGLFTHALVGLQSPFLEKKWTTFLELLNSGFIV